MATGLIAKITHGSNPGQILRYAMQAGHQPEIIGGNLTGTTPVEMTAEINHSLALQPQARGKLVWHSSLSFGETNLNNNQIADIAIDYLSAMGFDPERTQYTLIRHNDTEHHHAHLIASRVYLDGDIRLVPDWEFKASCKLCRTLEAKHGLAIDTSPERLVKARTKNEREYTARTGDPSIRQQIRQLVHTAATTARGSTLSDYIDALHHQGIEIKANISPSTARVNGISYSLNGNPMKGSDIGKAYSWQGIQRQFKITYDHQKDLDKLSRSGERTEEPDDTQTQNSSPDFERLSDDFKRITERNSDDTYSQTGIGARPKAARQTAPHNRKEQQFEQSKPTINSDQKTERANSNPSTNRPQRDSELTQRPEATSIQNPNFNYIKERFIALSDSERNRTTDPTDSEQREDDVNLNLHHSHPPLRDILGTNGQYEDRDDTEDSTSTIRHRKPAKSVETQSSQSPAQIDPIEEKISEIEQPKLTTQQTPKPQRKRVPTRNLD